MIPYESLVAVTGVVFDYVYTGPVVAAGYTKAIIYIYVKSQ